MFKRGMAVVLLASIGLTACGVERYEYKYEDTITENSGVGDVGEEPPDLAWDANGDYDVDHNDSIAIDENGFILILSESEGFIYCFESMQSVKDFSIKLRYKNGVEESYRNDLVMGGVYYRQELYGDFSDIESISVNGEASEASGSAVIPLIAKNGYVSLNRKGDKIRLTRGLEIVLITSDGYFSRIVGKDRRRSYMLEEDEAFFRVIEGVA